MGFAQYHQFDGLGLAHLVRRGEVSPTELLDEAMARIERHNPTLNAVVYKAYDEARATAKGRLPDGPFKGVPSTRTPLALIGLPLSSVRHIPTASKFSSAKPSGSIIA